MDEFQIQDFQNKLSELVGKTEAWQHMQSIDVYIKDTPSDWMTAFGAAFFGALAAFAINWFYEYRRGRDRQRNEINTAINNFAITLNMILPFKDQFLTKYQAELDLIQNHAIHYTDGVTAGLLKEYKEVIYPALVRLTQSGALLSWEEPEFIEITAPEKLSFFSDGMPDSIRIFASARDNVRQIRKTVALRNVHREKYIDLISDKMIKGEAHADPEVMRFIYEMLDFRKNILDYADYALAYINRSIELIQQYSKEYYPHPWKRIFKKKTWVKFKLPPQAMPLMPDMEKYKNVLHPEVGEETPTGQPAASTEN